MIKMFVMTSTIPGIDTDEPNSSQDQPIIRIRRVVYFTSLLRENTP